jgi:hypothetical protein
MYDARMKRSACALVITALSMVGCSPSEASDKPPDYPQGAVLPPEKPVAPDDVGGGDSSQDAPEISRSVGVAGGAVVLWPRVVLTRQGPSKPDDATRELARGLQSRMADLVKSAAGGKNVDVRPEPERVCPRAGCTAASVGILFAKAGEGCAAVALVSAPGKSPARLVPWLGAAKFSKDIVPFREQAEEAVRVTDFSKCTTLSEEKDRDGDVANAIKAAMK